ncbi:hypothetical protein N8I77_009329 [Diaporthe amygdali]|uniref:Uncharacterized protein n=1 Tax=Phomopsis amygdali TaxID=1214568 RepID=A0AAD9W2C8_PHOAM|nr:WNT and FGF inhibitory regulator domain-containing protein [Diaporthe amygdali]KAJ0114743.1 WNT and FGF inhibitory regulator domain-containing protein [Diaporthe amygdali]KAK2602824.1 hypothetical protein N8I77_009329 [Diaporthe amygdali]
MAAHRAPGPISPALQNSYGPEATLFEHRPQDGPQVVAFEAPEAIPGQSPYHGYVSKPYEEKQPPPPKERSKKILGLPVALFWVIIGVVILLVLGISLGVGLGVGLSQRATTSTSPSPSQSSSETSGDIQGTTSTAAASSTSSTATTSSISSSTSSAPVTSGTTGVADNSCTHQVPSTYYSSADQSVTFTTFCFTDWPNREDAADGNGTISDITYTIVYTFEDCMDKCVTYNKDLTEGQTKCAAVTYNSNLTSIVAVGQQGGNCFLKDKKGVNQQGSATSACAAIVY